MTEIKEELENLSLLENEAWECWEMSKEEGEGGDTSFLTQIMWIANRRAQLSGSTPEDSK